MGEKLVLDIIELHMLADGELLDNSLSTGLTSKSSRMAQCREYFCHHN